MIEVAVVLVLVLGHLVLWTSVQLPRALLSLQVLVRVGCCSFPSAVVGLGEGWLGHMGEGVELKGTCDNWGVSAFILAMEAGEWI